MIEPQQLAEPASFEFVCDDALLLHEFAHRTANEVAAALAALHLANRAKPSASARLMESAVRRLEAFGELHRVLARPVRRTSNVGADLNTVCAAIAGGATAASRSEMRLALPNIWISGSIARRIVLVAAELVTNAVRHALDGRAGVLEITLGIDDDCVVLTVADDGPGVRPGATSSGTGLGRGIVAQLVGRGDGSITMDSGTRGTTVRVEFPLGHEHHGRSDVPF
ncbi:ATP-binding protein [uncultured Sphingomonas sp.]|uniref:ATP-binding protein n=1 Tax=uncultured Sphingomonas sp. TaxID=158754 RepID=UPI003748B4ED